MLPRATFVSLLFALAACGAPLLEVEEVGDPIVYRGRVVTARGPTMARTGETCSVEVARANGGVLNCRIRIRCSGDLVYGLSGAGYNNCRQEGDELVFAHDSNGTRHDGDPRMFFDLESGRIIISDDDPDVEVLVDLVAQPEGYEREEEPEGEDAEEGESEL
jgi:hypothetical protein